MSVPNPVRLFHITAIENLPAIYRTGALISKNTGAAAGIPYQNIAHHGAQGARSVRRVPNPPGGGVHDYVPFYFAPRSPMLFAINGGQVEGCDLRQRDIAHLETTVERATAGGQPFVFYDRNATLTYSVPFTDLARLDEVAWDLLTENPKLDGFCKYWKNDLTVERYVDRMARRAGRIPCARSSTAIVFHPHRRCRCNASCSGESRSWRRWRSIASRSQTRLVFSSGPIVMPVHIAKGDLLHQDDVDAIVNTVNTVGVMGKGIALQFKNKWPANFDFYLRACKAGDVQPGRVLVFDAGALAKPHYIINFPTKKHWRSKSTIEDIRNGLEDLVGQIKRLGIRSIALPPLGCGNGGLDWNNVRPVIERAFAAVPEVEVRLFEPAGAPDPKSMEVRTARPRMTSGRAAILKLIETYGALNYGLSKVEVQKLAYFLQAAGQDLKLSFVKHQYGPYSEELRHALNRMEGHFIRGLGDGTSEAEIEPVPGALSEADKFLTSAGDSALLERVEHVQGLIEGFQSPYGMELLATIHWIATTEPDVADADSAIEAVHGWSERKRVLLKPAHIRVAWDRLASQGWFGHTPSVASSSERMAASSL